MTQTTDDQTTFRQAFGVLQQHAQTLREQDEPNIDDLLSIVTESVSAYKVCQERIDAVEKALEKALSETTATTSTKDARSQIKPPNSPTTSPPVKTIKPVQQPQSDEFDEGDIPF